MENKSQYKSLSEWRKADMNCYIIAKRKGMLPEICKKFGWEEIKKEGLKKMGYWTIEKCKEEALKYKTKTEWLKGDGKSYDAASRNGWVEECAMHMLNIKKPNGYWTEEKCIEEALKYKTVKEWAKKHCSSYTMAKNLKCLDKCTKHFIVTTKPKGYWTLQKCQEEGLKYNNIREWEKENKTSYSIARRKGFFDKCISHMTEIRKPNGYWTLERCKEDALNYKTKSEWDKKSGGAAMAAQKKGWHKECCKHMISGYAKRKI